MKDLTNTKIWIGNDPELSEKIQKRLFELGCYWNHCKNKYPTHCATYVLFINENKDLSTKHSTSKENFVKDFRKEIFLSDLFENEWIPKIGDKVIAIKDTITSEGHNPISKGIVKTIIGVTIYNNNNIWFYNDGLGSYIIEDWELYIKKENLSEVPYTEWNIGDTIESKITSNQLTKKSNYIILRFTEFGNPYIVYNNAIIDWAAYDHFKLVKRASQNIVKDDFVLPEKWCVIQKKIVAEWLNKLPNKNSSYSQDLEILAHYPKIDKTHCFRFIQKNYIEISIEQFQQYVLKESINTNQITQLNKKENECTSKESNNSKGITKSINRISGISSTREELRGFNYGFEKSYRRQRIGITETGSRRR